MCVYIFEVAFVYYIYVLKWKKMYVYIHKWQDAKYDILLVMEFVCVFQLLF